jgi:hypothetical protein
VVLSCWRAVVAALGMRASGWHHSWHLRPSLALLVAGQPHSPRPPACLLACPPDHVDDGQVCSGHGSSASAPFPTSISASQPPCHIRMSPPAHPLTNLPHLDLQKLKNNLLVAPQASLRHEHKCGWEGPPAALFDALSMPMLVFITRPRRRRVWGVKGIVFHGARCLDTAFGGPEPQRDHHFSFRSCRREQTWLAVSWPLARFAFLLRVERFLGGVFQPQTQ